MVDYNAKIVGNNIKKYRNAKNLSQKELSQRTGISVGYIASLENGILSKNGSGSISVFVKIANALCVTLDDIAGDNIEYKSYVFNNTSPSINKIKSEIEFVPYSKLLLFKNIINTLTKWIIINIWKV